VKTAQQVSGSAGEDAALAHLQAQGLRLVERNFLCRGGEIDLVMRDGASLVFVEVRLRAGARYGGALASIGPRKLARLRLAAQLYLQRLALEPACRFDVVAIEGDTLRWLKNVLQ
jgi:putative endonuclease